jgi:hypothetical protein
VGGPAHLAAVRIETPAAFAFERLSDPRDVGRWALGCLGLEPAGGALWRGRSILDGAEGLVEIRAHPGLWLIDFVVGGIPRIAIRVSPGEDAGIGAGACLAAMTAWRTAEMDEARWAQLQALHEAEVLIFKAQIEAAHRGGA